MIQYYKDVGLMKIYYNWNSEYFELLIVSDMFCEIEIRYNDNKSTWNFILNLN